MKLAWLLTFNAVVALLYAIPAVLAPGALYSLYGMSSTAGGLYVMQTLGGALLMTALLTWLMRDVPPGAARQSLTLALFAEGVVGLAVTLMAQLGGVLNTLGWGIVLLYVIFAVGYGYFRFVRPEAP